MTDTRTPIRCDVCLRELTPDEEWHTPHEPDCPGPGPMICNCVAIFDVNHQCPGTLPEPCRCAATTCPDCCWECAEENA